MPEDTCPKITFYAPSSKLGGDKPIPSCVPPVVKVPEVLYKPEGTEESEIPLKLPRPIELVNTAQTATCASIGKTGSEGLDVTVPAGDFQALLVFDSVPGIDREALDYIASNSYENDIEQLLRDGLLTSEYLTKLGLTKSQADEFLRLANDIIEMLNKSALSLASSMLECYWYNREVTAECPEDAAETGQPEGSVKSYTVPAGHIKSLISQADADKQARIIAESSINCLYLSEPVEADCVTRPDAPAEGLAEVPNDIEPVYEGLIPRRGFVELPAGAVVSETSVSDATEQAQSMAYSMLVCYYVNNEITERCEDANARDQNVNPVGTSPKQITVPSDERTGQIVTVPMGYITSDLSTVLATEEATLLAQSMLECCYMNQEKTAKCPEDAVETGEYEGAVKSYTVPTGAVIGCTSQDEVDKQAEELAESMLTCIYCSKLINPTCVPDWVVTAATEGIELTKEASIPVLRKDQYEYVHYNAGDIYRINLPLNQKIYYNPVLDIVESITMWSEDATVGAPEGYQCMPDLDQANQVADVIASTNLHLLLQVESKDNCTYTNDLLIAGCNFEDPYGKTPTTASNTYKIQYYRSVIPVSEEVYYLYRQNVDPRLSTGESGQNYQGLVPKSYSSPEIGNYVSIPAGTISITKDDVPEDYKPTGIATESYKDKDEDGNPIEPETGTIEYPGLTADISETQKIKAYANDLALEMAKGMIECNYINYQITASCDEGAIDPRPSDLQLTPVDNKIIWEVAAGSFVGKEFNTVIDLAKAALGAGPVCLYPNDSRDCGEDCEDCVWPEDLDLPSIDADSWSKSNPLTGGITIPAGSFYADTKVKANAMAYDMCEYLKSAANCVYTVSNAKVDCGASCSSLGFIASTISDDEIILNPNATSSENMTVRVSASSTDGCAGIVGTLTALCSAKCAAAAAIAYTNTEITHTCIPSNKEVTLPPGTFVGTAEEVKGLIEIWKESVCGETISLIAGDYIQIVNQNNTYTISVSPIPGETISLIAGDNINITNSGNVYTISCTLSPVPGETISLIAGDYIHIDQQNNTYTISVSPIPSSNISIIAGDYIHVAQQDNTYTISVSPIPGESISIIAGDYIHVAQQDNTYTISVSPVPSANISLIAGDYIKIDKSDDSYTISVSPIPGESISLIAGDYIHIDQQNNTYTISVSPIPSSNISIIAGDYIHVAQQDNTYTISVSPIPSANISIIAGDNIKVTNSGDTYTISCTLSPVPNETLSIIAGTGIDITGSASTGYTVACTVSPISYDFDPSYFTVSNNYVTMNIDNLAVSLISSATGIILPAVDSTAIASVTRTTNSIIENGDIMLAIGKGGTPSAKTDWQ